MRVLHLVQWLTPRLHDGGVTRCNRLGRIIARFAEVDAVGFHSAAADVSLETAVTLQHYRNLYPVPLGGPLKRDMRVLANLGRGHSLRSAAFRAAAYRRRVRDLVRTRRYDVIQAETLSILQNLESAAPGVPIVYSAHNVESVLSSRLLRARTTRSASLSAAGDPSDDAEGMPLGAAARSLAFDRRRTENEERRALEMAALCLAVSEADKALLERLASARCCPIHVIPNCVGDEIGPVDPAAPTVSPPVPEVACIGSFAWYPNSQGALWFLNEVLPHLRKYEPTCSIRFVGSGIGVRLARAIRDRGCAYSANVPSTLPYLHRARAAVVPLLVGGGTRIKIVEAWAAGVPVISTRIGAEGLDCIHALDAMLADDPHAFASALGTVLRDPDLHRRLRANGLRRAETLRWSRVAPVIERLYDSLQPMHSSTGRIGAEA